MRAGIHRVVGRIAPRGAGEAGWLVEGLKDPDARVRRHAAVALGKLRDSAAAATIEDALLAAWDRGPGADLERAIAASLGKLGSTRALERLRGMKSSDSGSPEISRVAGRAALMVTRDVARKTPGRSTRNGHRPGPSAWCSSAAAGWSAMVADEARECPGVCADRASDLGARAGVAPARRLAGECSSASGRRRASRAVLPAVPLRGRPEDCSRPRALVRGGTPDPRDVDVGVVRYRIAWAGGGHQRARTWRAAQAISRPPATG